MTYDNEQLYWYRKHVLDYRNHLSCYVWTFKELATRIFILLQALFLKLHWEFLLATWTLWTIVRLRLYFCLTAQCGQWAGDLRPGETLLSWQLYFISPHDTPTAGCCPNIYTGLKTMKRSYKREFWASTSLFVCSTHAWDHDISVHWRQHVWCDDGPGGWYSDIDSIYIPLS